MRNFVSANGSDVAAAELDDVWEDVSDSPRHAYTLDREWTRRQNQFQKVLNTLEFIHNAVVNASYSSAVFADSRNV
jgi:protein gp37